MTNNAFGNIVVVDIFWHLKACSEVLKARGLQASMVSTILEGVSCEELATSAM